MACRKYINERGDPVFVTEESVKLIIDTYKAERPSDEELLKTISETMDDLYDSATVSTSTGTMAAAILNSLKTKGFV